MCSQPTGCGSARLPVAIQMVQRRTRAPGALQRRRWRRRRLCPPAPAAAGRTTRSRAGSRAPPSPVAPASPSAPAPHAPGGLPISFNLHLVLQNFKWSRAYSRARPSLAALVSPSAAAVLHAVVDACSPLHIASVLVLAVWCTRSSTLLRNVSAAPRAAVLPQHKGKVIPAARSLLRVSKQLW